MDLGDVGELAMIHHGVKRKGTAERPAWYVENRLVARWLDAGAAVIRADFAGRERLLAEHPETFGVPPRFENHQMIVVELDRADPAAVRRAISEAVELQRRV